MNSKIKMKNFKILLIILVVIIVIILAFNLLPFISQLSTSEGQIAFKNKIEGMGFTGVLMLFGLQIAQILLVIIPGEPLEILAGMCYGTVRWNFIYNNICIYNNNNNCIIGKKIWKKFYLQFF